MVMSWNNMITLSRCRINSMTNFFPHLLTQPDTPLAHRQQGSASTDLLEMLEAPAFATRII